MKRIASMKPIALVAIAVILSVPATAVAQGAFGDSDYVAVLLHSAKKVTGNYREGSRLREMTGGVHITFIAEDPEGNLDVKAETIEFIESEGGGETSRILLRGDAVIANRGNVVSAEQADVDFETGLAVFTGNPAMDTEEVQGLRAGKMIINLNTGDFELSDLEAGRIELDSLGDAPKDRHRLSSQDVRDWPGFLAILKRQAEDPAPTPGKRILDTLDEKVRSTMAAASVDMLVGQQDDILKQLNKALASTALYGKEAWAGVKLGPEAAGAIAEGLENLPAENVAWFNRHLLQAAYPRHIAPPDPLIGNED